jgi:acetoin utilization deacetylase AcuC-like enzyme
MISQTGYIYSDFYLEHEPSPLSPETPLRLAALHATIVQSPLFSRLIPIAPITDSEIIVPNIAAIHSADHISAVRKCGVSGEVAICAVGGVLAAIDAVCRGEIINAFCAVRPPGHHAHNDVNKEGRGQGEGFCFFNNVAIGARYAQHKRGLRSILIIDWDYHHGNGTEDAFYSDPTVFYFSTHDLKAYPGTGFPLRIGEGSGRGYNLNVPLPLHEMPSRKVTDEHLLAALNRRLFPALEAQSFLPDLILLSAGFDGREGDTFGGFSFTDEDFYQATMLVKEFAEKVCNGRMVSVLEGGYDPVGLASAGLAHIKALLAQEPI